MSEHAAMRAACSRSARPVSPPQDRPIHTVQSRFFPLSAVPIFRALAALATTPRPAAAVSRHSRRSMIDGASDRRVP
jgi:hypothetical protein